MHGVCVSLLERDTTGLDSTFREQVASYLLHLDSDHDMWAALVSGCFLDRVYYPPGEADFPPGHRPYPFSIRDWWKPSERPPTSLDVIREWETVRAEMVSSVRMEEWLGPSEELQDILQNATDTINSHLAYSGGYDKAVAESRVRLREIMLRWVDIGIDIPTSPLRMW